MFAKSKQKIQEKDEDYSPNKKKRKKQKRFIFELFNIFDIHMEMNYALRLIIIDFITNGLVNIQENVTRILTTENTSVIMIVNRHQLDSDDGVLSRESIVGVIIFGGHCTDGFLIDYLVIRPNYKYLSFGALLINIAQS